MRLSDVIYTRRNRRLRCWTARPERSSEKTLKQDGETVREFYRSLRFGGHHRRDAVTRVH